MDSSPKETTNSIDKDFERINLTPLNSEDKLNLYQKPKNNQKGQKQTTKHKKHRNIEDEHNEDKIFNITSPEKNKKNSEEIYGNSFESQSYSDEYEEENFLDKIIQSKKTIVGHTNPYSEYWQEKDSRKSILHTIARCSSFIPYFSEDEFEKTIEQIHLKPENEKTEKEREIEVLEQIGLNCIYARESFKMDKLAEKHSKYKEFHDKIIVGNMKWVQKKIEEDKDFFISLCKPQKPKYLVISCSDSRVVVNEFTATEPGDVFTHRNIGNLVISTDFNCQSVLQFAIEYLKVEHILVIGHTDCGAIKAALSYDHHGLIDHWLKNIREVAEKHEKELEDSEHLGHDYIVRKLIELNIREQCLNLCKSPIVQKAWDSGHDLYIHGYVFEMETGFLKDLEVVQKDWSNIQEIYKYHFRK